MVGHFTGTEWTPTNGVVNSSDFVAAIKTFQDPNAISATHVSVTDIEPALNGDRIDVIVAFNEVLFITLGFQGQEYPGPDIEQCS